MQTHNNILRLLSRCYFKIFDTYFDFDVMDKGDGYLIQVKAFVTDNHTLSVSCQKGGKHYISAYAIDDEVIMKAWKACYDFVVHEAREGFKYKGQAIFGPHFQVDEMVEFCKTANEAKRL